VTNICKQDKEKNDNQLLLFLYSSDKTRIQIFELAKRISTN